MRITRRTGLAMLAASAALGVVPSLPATAAARLYELTPQKVGDGIWMVEGSRDYFSPGNGGAIVNCVLVETRAGMVVIDTGSSRLYGEALRSVAGRLGTGGIAAVVNTHHHPDHFFGNQVVADRPIHALAGTATHARQEGDDFADNLYRMLGDWMRGTEPAPPTDILQSGVLEIGGRRFRLFPLSGHTGADLALLDERTGTLIAGDLAFLDRAPTTPHADLKEWRTSIGQLQAQEASLVIPGHGPADRERRSLAQTLDYLDWLEASLDRAAEEGLDMMEVMQTPLPERFAAMGAMPGEFERSVVHLYPEIERARLPRAQQ